MEIFKSAVWTLLIHICATGLCSSVWVTSWDSNYRVQFAHAAGIFLSSVNYFWPKYFLAIILKRQWAHKRKHLLQVRRFRQCRHKRGCQCMRSKVRQQQILLHWVTQYSRTTPGRHHYIYYAILAHISYQAAHGHMQVCGIANLLTHIFSYGD